jgi:hypothetical protein
MLTVLGGLAEFERELIRARTGEGRKRAKERGVRFGRPRKMTPHQRLARVCKAWRAFPPALLTPARVRLQTYRQAGTAEIGRTRANFSPSSARPCGLSSTAGLGGRAAQFGNAEID